MEKFQELREIAKKKIQIADHMLTQTFPMIQDPKLLLVVMENIFLGLTNAMGALLHYERTFKKIPPFFDNFDSKFTMFTTRIVGKYKIDPKYVHLISEVKEIIVQHKKSPIEFVRHDKLVICNEEYKMKSISTLDIRELIKQSKEFNNIVNGLTLKNENIFIEARK
jgi:hypothetical protein